MWGLAVVAGMLCVPAPVQKMHSYGIQDGKVSQKRTTFLPLPNPVSSCVHLHTPCPVT